MARYRIEKRQDGQPTEYWREGGALASIAKLKGRWTTVKGAATLYTESERETALQAELRGEGNGFPAGGCWVRLDNEKQTIDYVAPPPTFTVEAASDDKRPRVFGPCKDGFHGDCTIAKALSCECECHGIAIARQLTATTNDGGEDGR